MSYHPIKPAVIVTQGTWFIDPQNSTGLASDANSGIDALHPVLSYNGGVAAKWGTYSPTFPQDTTLTWLSSQLLTGDPIILTPILEHSVLKIVGVLGAGQLVHSGALAGVVAKNRTTGQLLQVDLGFAAPVGALVKNTQAGKVSFAWVYKAVAGTTFALTQPLAPQTAPITALPTEVDTWANIDTFEVYVPVSIDLDVIDCMIDGYASAVQPDQIQIQWVTLAEPGTVFGGEASIGNDVDIIECVSQVAIVRRAAGDSVRAGAIALYPAIYPVYSNFFCHKNVTSAFNAIQFWGGALLSALVSSISWSPDYDAILDASGGGILMQSANPAGNPAFGLFYVAGTLNCGVSCSFVPGFSASGQSIAWGPGKINTTGPNRLVYGAAAGAAVATFKNAGGLSLNGLGNANAFNPATGAYSVGTIAVTPANLDLAFGAGGFGGLAVNVTGASISNQGNV